MTTLLVRVFESRGFVVAKSNPRLTATFLALLTAFAVALVRAPVAW